MAMRVSKVLPAAPCRQQRLAVQGIEVGDDDGGQAGQEEAEEDEDGTRSGGGGAAVRSAASRGGSGGSATVLRIALAGSMGAVNSQRTPLRFEGLQLVRADKRAADGTGALVELRVCTTYKVHSVAGEDGEPRSVVVLRRQMAIDIRATQASRGFLA